MRNESSLFRVLSDTTRLRLYALLLFKGERCVCDLARALSESDFKISRHLGVMRSAGIVEVRREGTWMYYKAVEPRSLFETLLHEFLRRALADHPTLIRDLENLPDLSCVTRTIKVRKNTVPEKSTD